MASKLKLGLGALAVFGLGYLGLKGYQTVKHAYYSYQYQMSPELESTKKDSRKQEGRDIGQFHTTTYNTAYERYYPSWSTTGKKQSGPDACQLSNKGFYEAVRCEGSGIGKNGLLYTAKSIKPTKAESKSEKTKGCLGYTADGNCVKVGRSIAVDPEIIPRGTLVRLEFQNKNGTPCTTDVCEKFDGWYEAQDVGGSIKGRDIDVYAGRETGRDQYIGRDLPQRANVYIAKKPEGNLERILKNRSPRIRKH